MKRSLLLLLFFAAFQLANAQIVITEIMYNPPESGSDSLEYIELYNNSAGAVNMSGYNFSAGVTYTFSTNFTLGAGEYVIVAVDSAAFENNFGVSAFQWVDGGLSNGGEEIVLVDAQGSVVDSVDYDDSNGWPPNADGLGASLVLCDFDSDNADPANWASATTGTGIIINGIEVFANAGAESQCVGGPIIRFLESSQEVSEADGSVEIEVALFDGEIGLTGTVIVAIGIGSSAIQGLDYNYTPATLTFLTGAETDTQSVTINLIDDIEPESLESLILELVSPGGGASIDPVNASFDLQIADNDTQTPDIVISEIMYNNPGTDDYEYLELVNNDSEAVNLEGYSFSEGFVFTFPSFTLQPGEYVIIASDSALFEDAFEITPFEFESGALNNGGEDIELRDAGGNVVDYVDYSPNAPWDEGANGSGSALILCDLNADNNDPSNWRASNTPSGVFISGTQILGSPGSANDCSDAPPPSYPPYSVGVVTTNDSNGVPDSIGRTCQLQGVVYGENLRPGGLQFTLIDDQNDGIHIFSSAESYGYTVVEGDEVIVQGTIGQFNGLTQLNLDTVWMVSSNNSLVAATEVTALDESTESQLITILNLTIVDPLQWLNTGSGFNVDVTNGTDTVQMRIDADVNIFGTLPPVGMFNLIGIGGQFDGSSPFDEGYQILPRYLPDIDPVSSISEAEFEQGIRNPSKEVFKIEMQLPVHAIQISDVFGQQLFYSKAVGGDMSLSLKNYPNGVYIITFISEGVAWSTQLVKQ